LPGSVKQRVPEIFRFLSGNLGISVFGAINYWNFGLTREQWLVLKKIIFLHSVFEHY
jgi:hypothetical protein